MSLDLQMHGQDKETPLATAEEISTAIIIRHALNDASILDTSAQLGKLLAPYGLSLADLQDGLPERKVRV